MSQIKIYALRQTLDQHKERWSHMFEQLKAYL